jgi:hypothetical protein
VACDTSARKKLKALDDRVDEPEDKESEENEKLASILQLEKANELKLLPKRSSPHAGQVSKTDETLFMGRVIIGEDFQRITCHEINMQRVEQENPLSLKTGFSDNTDSFPLMEKKFESFSAKDALFDFVTRSTV